MYSIIVQRAIRKRCMKNIAYIILTVSGLELDPCLSVVKFP
jgi:hypothetical protein